MYCTDSLWKQAKTGICPFCKKTNTIWTTDASDRSKTPYLWCKNCDGAPMLCYDNFVLVSNYEATQITICPKCGEETASGSDGLKHLLVLGSI